MYLLNFNKINIRIINLNPQFLSQVYFIYAYQFPVEELLISDKVNSSENAKEIF